MMTRRLVEKFKGENFLACSDRFKSLMILENELYEQMFKGADSKDTEIDDSDFSNDQVLGLSKRLKHMFLLHCDSKVDPTLRSHTTYHGLELWRRLHQQFNPTSKMTSMGRLVNIISARFDISTLEQQIFLWGQAISKYESGAGSPLPITIKIAILIKGASGPLQHSPAGHGPWQADGPSRQDR
jgi:hypothetical protein